MKYAALNEQMRTLHNVCGDFQETIYDFYEGGRLLGATSKEQNSIEAILACIKCLNEEFAKWSWDDTKQGDCYKEGKPVPYLKEYLKGGKHE